MASIQASKARRWLLGVAVGTATIIAVPIFIVVLSAGNDPVHRAGATQVPSFCDSSLPGFTLTQCETTHQKLQAQSSQDWPVSGPIQSAASIATEITPGPLSVGGQLVHVVASYEYETTYGEAGTLMEATNPYVVASTPVWIVTQHWSGPIVTRTSFPGLHAPPADWAPPSVSTVIVDAVSGTPIDSCDGCDVVQSNGQAVAVTLSP